MSLQTVQTARLARRGRIAVLAVAITATVGAATIVTVGGEPSQSATNRSFDIEANKAASMGTLGRHMMDRDRLRPARVDAAMHAATMRAIGAASAR
jgi:hypothetical protein